MSGCSGDTFVQTEELGIVRINTIVGRRLRFWDGHEWTEGVVCRHGKQPVYNVEFIGAQMFECSPNFPFCVEYANHHLHHVECRDLRCDGNSSTHNHHVLVSPEYSDSTHVYSSKEYRSKFLVKRRTANNHFIDDLQCSSFNKGVVLGRLASNGHYSKRGYASTVRLIVAEHEYSIRDQLYDYAKGWNPALHPIQPRGKSRQELTYIELYSTALRNELLALDLRNHIADDFFMDTALLRGLLRGWFDGDGTIGQHNISLTQGVQDDFEHLFRDVQKALLFCGIRGRYRYYPGHRHSLSVTKVDTDRFLDLIGFIAQKRTDLASTLHGVKGVDQRVFSKCLIVKSVTATGNEANMYSVRGTHNKRYVADGMVVCED